MVQVLEFFSFLDEDEDDADDEVDAEELSFDLDFLVKRPMEKDNFCFNLDGLPGAGVVAAAPAGVVLLLMHCSFSDCSWTSLTAPLFNTAS